MNRPIIIDYISNDCSNSLQLNLILRTEKLGTSISNNVFMSILLPQLAGTIQKVNLELLFDLSLMFFAHRACILLYHALLILYCFNIWGSCGRAEKIKIV